MISDRKKKETNTSSYSIISIDKEIEKECEDKLFIVIIRHTEYKKGEKNG